MWWHAFGQDLDGIYMVLVAGPTEKGPGEVPVLEDLTFLQSFDHKPTELEKDRCQPEEFWQLNDNGELIPRDWDWEDEAMHYKPEEVT